MALEQLLQGRTDIWRGNGVAPAAPSGVASGHAELDALLPGGGWPRGALSEILCDGAAGFALILPALASLSRAGRWILLVAPPHLPYAPALAGRGLDLRQLLLVREQELSAALWAGEQGLRSGACAAVAVWAEEAAPAALRRLQLAAEKGAGAGFLLRGEVASKRPCPAPLRVRVRLESGGLAVRVLKRRGGAAQRELVLPAL